MIYIILQLCPSRHCTVAAAYDNSMTTADETIRVLKDHLKERKTPPICDVCGSSQLHWEQRGTYFRSMAEATPHLRAAERKNVAEKRRETTKN